MNMINTNNNKIWSEVYRLCSQIPRGFVSTYKEIANFLEISPRVVGQALRNNPHLGVVPCHRVISSNYFIGGFHGQWGKGEMVDEKIFKLNSEGVQFDEKGYLLKNLRDKTLFREFV